VRNLNCLSDLNMLICVPVKENTQKMASKRLFQIKGKADLAEIWLDRIKDLDIKKLLINSPLPIICVCKKPSEKGSFKGSYSEMADILLEAVKNDAEYVDIPFNMPKNLSNKIFQYCQRSKVKGQKSQVIISFHDFRKTPPFDKMFKIVREMKKRGADIVKIAVMAKSFEDTFSVIFLARQLQAEKIPHILIAMGKKGILSRVITPFLGGTIMFAPLEAKLTSASGQLTVNDLNKAWDMFKK